MRVTLNGISVSKSRAVMPVSGCQIAAVIGLVLAALLCQPTSARRSSLVGPRQILEDTDGQPASSLNSSSPSAENTPTPGSPGPIDVAATATGVCNCLGSCCCFFSAPNYNSSTLSCSPWSDGGASATCAAITAPQLPTQIRLRGEGTGTVSTLELSGPDGPSWSLSNANGSIGGLAVSVPGYALQALRDADILGSLAADMRSDPLYRFNELEFRWVAMDTWTFSTAFTLPGKATVLGGSGGGDGEGGRPGETRSGRGIRRDGCGWDLVLEGVDTVADVLLNGQVLARLQNFHRSYRLDVRQILRAADKGANDLSIVLHPAVPYVRQQAASYPYPMPSNTAPGSFGQFAFIRKPASDLGWDWGPAFAPAGVHGAVRLVRYCAPYVAGIHLVEQIHNTSGAVTSGGSGASGGGRVDAGLVGTISLVLEAEVRVPPSMPPPPLLAPTSGASALRTVTAQPVVIIELHDPASGGDGSSALGRVERPVGQDAPSATDRTQFLRVRMDVDASTVRLWWPVGFGGQPLYVLSGWIQHHKQAGAVDFERDEGEGAHATAGSADIGGTSNSNIGGISSNSNSDIGSGSSSSSRSGAQAWGWRETPGAGPQQPLQRRVGFRTVELVTVPPDDAMAELVDLYGSDRGGTAASAAGSHAPGAATSDFPKAPNETFFLRVNGQPVFARGANLVPLHVLHTDPLAVRPEAMAGLLASALGSGMNMIRVWGGGRYQMEELYDMADGAGLLLWQEFMFACNPYPNTVEFSEEVRQEVAEQVRRLAGHPSVAIWGGNNEIEVSFDWFTETRANRQLYAADFVTQFTELIRGMVLQLDPDRPYVDSSPSSGLYSRMPYIKRWGNPQDQAAGDIHYYNYSSDCLDPGMYPTPRFVSEYGYQSFASYEVIRQYGMPSDFTPLSEFMRHRQRHPKGESELIASLGSHFRQPPAGWGRGSGNGKGDGGGSGGGGGGDGRFTFPGSDSDRQQQQRQQQRQLALNDSDFLVYQSWIYQLQMQQLLCYSTALGRWRSLRSDPRVMTMGVLYWQLNDIWPGYSWSSLDFGGSWKPLHSLVRRVFAPVVVVASYYKNQSSNVSVYVVNDSPQEAAVQLAVIVVSLVPCSAANRSTDANGKVTTNTTQSSPSTDGMGSGGDHGGSTGSLHSGGDIAQAAQFAVLNLTAPPQRGTLVLDVPVATLLAVIPECTETTCVVLLRLRILALGGVEVNATNMRGGGGNLLWPWGRGDPGVDTAALVEMAFWRNSTAGSGSGFGMSRRALFQASIAGTGSSNPNYLNIDNNTHPTNPNASSTNSSTTSGGAMDTDGRGERGMAKGWDWSRSEALVMLVPPKDLNLSQPEVEVYDVQMRTLPPAGRNGTGTEGNAARPASGFNARSNAAATFPGAGIVNQSTSTAEDLDAASMGSVGRSINGSEVSIGATAATGVAGIRYKWCFRLRARRAPALLVSLGSSLRGRFSENFILLLFNPVENATENVTVTAPAREVATAKNAPQQMPVPMSMPAVASTATFPSAPQQEELHQQRGQERLPRNATQRSANATQSSPTYRNAMPPISPSRNATSPSSPNVRDPTRRMAMVTSGTGSGSIGSLATERIKAARADLQRQAATSRLSDERNITRAEANPRICFYTDEEIEGNSEEKFLATLFIRDLHSMQAF